MVELGEKNKQRTEMDDRRYYDFQWQQTGGKEHPYVAEKVKLILDIIPRDVRTIIDVGCGDGAITNILAERYTVVGTDISRDGLKQLLKKAQPVASDAGFLPFKDGCAELVLSSELLEHLSGDVFIKAVSEIKRISGKYLLISVPNNEKLRKRFTRCRHCGFEFHIYCHMRSFNLKKLARYFDGYNICYSTLCGALDEPTFDVISYLKNKVAKAYFFVDTVSILCPNCGQTASRFGPNLAFRLAGFSLYILQNFLNLLLNKKSEPDWLVVLFERGKI